MKLHIGGTIVHPDWKILNYVDGDGVDYVGTCTDLSLFADESVDAIYMSHVLEHLTRTERAACLLEINRVLRPDGEIYVAVPNLMALANILFRNEGRLEVELGVNNMLFGGEGSPEAGMYNFHKCGYTAPILYAVLEVAGFGYVTFMDDLGIFDDASNTVYRGVRVSLNAKAKKVRRVTEPHDILFK